MNVKKKENYLDILQVFRGIAALMVVCHHTIISIIYYHKVDSPFFYSLGILGKYGVDFFFVLSGFIISYTVFYKYDEPNSFKNYIKNRLVRIYVPYLPIGLFMFIIYTFLPSVSNSERNISAFTSLTLLPHGHPALSVAWSLTYELLFYFLFSISFYSKKSWHALLTVWLVLILTFNYTELRSLNLMKTALAQVLFSPYNLEFMLGFVLSMLYINQKKLYDWMVYFSLAITTLGFTLLVLSSAFTFKFATNFLFSFAAFFLLYVTLKKYNIELKKTNIWMIIGNATYSIYLIHNPLQAIIIRTYPQINSVISLIFALLLSLAVCTALGYVYFLVFEKWASSKLKSIVTK